MALLVPPRRTLEDALVSKGSEHKWGEGWQVPPVICPGCGLRVTLKQAFYGSAIHGTFYAECAPYTVAVVVSA